MHRNTRRTRTLQAAALLVAALLLLPGAAARAGEEEAEAGTEDEAEAEAEADKPSARDRLPPADRSRLIVKIPHSGARPHILDIHGGVGSWGFGFGAGARFTLNIIENGFASKLNNSFGLGFGADLLVHPAHYGFDKWGFTVSLPLVGQWAFYLTPKWTVFAEFGATIWIRPYGEYKGSLISKWFDIWFVLGPGAMWNFSDSMSLIIRATYPYFSVGLTFSI